MTQPLHVAGLWIPANPFVGCRTGLFPLDDDLDCPQFQPVRDEIDADLIEIIYPARVDELTINITGTPLTIDRSTLVALGDEEARMVPSPVPNGRATLLLGYPYPIVGDVVLFGYDDDTDIIGGLDDDLLSALKLPRDVHT